MIDIPLGIVIATRVLTFTRENNSSLAVAVSIGAPMPDPPRAWACPYEIVGMWDPLRRAMRGADSMQALILTMHILPTELLARAREQEGRVSEAFDFGLNEACRMQLGLAS